MTQQIRKEKTVGENLYEVFKEAPFFCICSARDGCGRQWYWYKQEGEELVLKRFPIIDIYIYYRRILFRKKKENEMKNINH